MQRRYSAIGDTCTLFDSALETRGTRGRIPRVLVCVIRFLRYNTGTRGRDEADALRVRPRGDYSLPGGQKRSLVELGLRWRAK